MPLTASVKFAAGDFSSLIKLLYVLTVVPPAKRIPLTAPAVVEMAPVSERLYILFLYMFVVVPPPILIPLTMGEVTPEPDKALMVLENIFTVVPAVEFIPEILQDASLDETVLMVLPFILPVIAAPAFWIPIAFPVVAEDKVLMVLVLIFKVVDAAVL